MADHEEQVHLYGLGRNLYALHDMATAVERHNDVMREDLAELQSGQQTSVEALHRQAGGVPLYATAFTGSTG